MVSVWCYSLCASLHCHPMGASEGRMLNTAETEVVSSGMVFEISFVKTIHLCL
jgi:hypothetical protein